MSVRVFSLILSLAVLLSCGAVIGCGGDSRDLDSDDSSSVASEPARHQPVGRFAPLARSWRTVRNLLDRIGDPGDDQTIIAPDLTALCQEQLGNLDVYGPPAPDVDAIVHDPVITSTRGGSAGCNTSQN